MNLKNHLLQPSKTVRSERFAIPYDLPDISFDTIVHQVVSRFAYEAWERSGRPEGRDLEFWLQGERQFNTLVSMSLNIQSISRALPSIQEAFPDSADQDFWPTYHMTDHR